MSRGDGPARPLPPSAAAAADLLAVPVTRKDRTGGPPSASTVGDVLAIPIPMPTWCCRTGELVTEWYGPLGAPDRTTR